MLIRREFILRWILGGSYFAAKLVFDEDERTAPVEKQAWQMKKTT